MVCVCIPYYHEGHHFVEWIAQIFHQCVYTRVQVASFCLGLCSIGFWLFAQLPQIIKTYMSGSVESLSMMFLLTWLVGDITNLIGCLLTHQLPTQLYTAIYYCSMDVIMVSQYFYYRIRNRSKSIVLPNNHKQKKNNSDGNNEKTAAAASSSVKHSRHATADVAVVDGEHLYHKKSIDVEQEGVGGLQHKSDSPQQRTFLYSYMFLIAMAGATILFTVVNGGMNASSTNSARSIATLETVGQERAMMMRSRSDLISMYSNSGNSGGSTNGRKLLGMSDATDYVNKNNYTNLFSNQPEICDASMPLSKAERIVGDVSAWVSGILYFTARLPQIYLNYQRKSVEGLSLPMFLCAILGNTSYGLSVLILGIHDVPAFMENTFPYILGSICTLSMSAVIISQFVLYALIPAIKARRRRAMLLKESGTVNNDSPAAYANNDAGVYFDEEDESETTTLTATSIDGEAYLTRYGSYHNQ